MPQKSTTILACIACVFFYSCSAAESDPRDAIAVDSASIDTSMDASSTSDARSEDGARPQDASSDTSVGDAQRASTYSFSLRFVSVPAKNPAGEDWDSNLSGEDRKPDLQVRVRYAGSGEFIDATLVGPNRLEWTPDPVSLPAVERSLLAQGFEIHIRDAAIGAGDDSEDMIVLAVSSNQLGESAPIWDGNDSELAADGYRVLFRLTPVF